MLSEFLEKKVPNFPYPQLGRHALVWGHCHHRSVAGLGTEEAVLKKLGLEYQVATDATCCGMAGSFGFEHDHYQVASQIGELGVLPRVRQAAKDTIIIADGFSCQTQIRQGKTGRQALHLAQVVKMARDKGVSGLPPGSPPEADYPKVRPVPSQPATGWWQRLSLDWARRSLVAYYCGRSGNEPCQLSGTSLLRRRNSSRRPGRPGRWQGADKAGVGTALGSPSGMWFTLRQGIVTEVFCPNVDAACIRDLGLIVTDGKSFFSEEQADTDSVVEWLGDGIPAYRLTNSHRGGRYRIVKEIITDPRRSCSLQRIRFEATEGGVGQYHLYAILNPRLDNRSGGSTAWVGDYRGRPMLFAERDHAALAPACWTDWCNRSVGYVGVSDGWQDLHQHCRMTWTWTKADSGNVALTGEIDLHIGNGFVLAMGFGQSAAAAGHHAACSLNDGFEAALQDYRRGWKAWHETMSPMDSAGPHVRDLYRTSTTVLRTHESSNFPGAVIASLSVPWDAIHGNEDLGGYGEHADGSPFDGNGIGRAWPLLTAERGHYELAAGHFDEAQRLIQAMESFANESGMIPEQVWDADDIPARGLFLGRPTGSANPLVWRTPSTSNSAAVSSKAASLTCLFKRFGAIRSSEDVRSMPPGGSVASRRHCQQGRPCDWKR